MTDLTRRSVLAGAAAGAVALGASAVAKAAEYGNPDSPLQGAINSTPAAISEPGPQNPQLRDVLPSFNNPPPTDVGGMPIPWVVSSWQRTKISPFARCFSHQVRRSSGFGLEIAQIGRC